METAIAPQFVASLTVDELDQRLRRIVREEIVSKQEPVESGYLETAEAAAFLKVRPHTIPSLVKRDKIPHTRRGTGPKAPYLFRREDLIAYLEKRSTVRGAHARRHYESIQRLRENDPTA